MKNTLSIWVILNLVLITGFSLPLSGQDRSGKTLEYIQQFKDKEKPIPPLPSGPKGAGPFGAYYTKLEYYPEWDQEWRAGAFADVVVRFDRAGYKFVFWRGTNYIPHWVTENNIWYNNEFTETWETIGSSEPMSDKQCRYSHVRVIESHSARAVVHWRYALTDVNYRIAWPDSNTGWGDWCDEYYYLYPDGFGVRKIILYSSYREDDERHTDDAGHEWHEGIVVYHAYTTPEDAVNVDAVHVGNMKGEVGIWEWQEAGEPTTPTPAGSNIAMMNLKSKFKPFVISAEGCHLSAYEGHQGGSRFRWRDHWPTTLEPTPGRNASGTQAAHGSFFHITDIPVYRKEGVITTKILLHGMTDKAVADLVPLARSWLNPPEAGTFSGCKNIMYDPSERAFMFSGCAAPLRATLNASEQSPLVNPVFIFKNLNQNDYQLNINGERQIQGDRFRSTMINRLESSELIVWIDQVFSRPVIIELD